MDAYLDDLLDELVTVEPREGWNDVLRRARRSHRRYVTAAAGVGALVLAPAGWAIQHVALSAQPSPAAPPAYQPSDKVWNTTPPVAPVTTTITCSTIDDAANLLAQLQREGSPVNDVECSNTPSSSAGLTPPGPYRPGNPVQTGR